MTYDGSTLNHRLQGRCLRIDIYNKANQLKKQQTKNRPIATFFLYSFFYGLKAPYWYSILLNPLEKSNNLNFFIFLCIKYNTFIFVNFIDIIVSCLLIFFSLFALQSCAREEILANGGSISHHHGGK